VSSPGDVTRLLQQIQAGNQGAESELIPLVYDELRRLAAHFMRQERPDHTLQATALVHEAYLRLVNQREVNWQNKAQFFALAGKLMRRVLVDYARARGRSKRGGSDQKVCLDELPDLPAEGLGEVNVTNLVELIEVDRALSRLAKERPRQSQVVELRFFGGLPVEEIAEVLNISPKTVKRDWNVARAWLHREIRKEKDK